MIKAIVFDYGGVVGTNVMPYIHLRVAERFKLNINEVIATYKKYIPQAQRGEISMNLFWHRVAEALKINPDQLEQTWLDIFNKKYRTDSEVKELIRLLKNGGYKIALCTNNIKPFVNWHKEKGHFDIFPVQVISTEVGMRKPEKEIYEYVAKQLDVKPEECAFVDDKPVNVEGAKNIGMKAILFRNVRQLKDELKRHGIYGL